MITCGNCRNQHSTAAQVRACYQVKSVGFSHHPKAKRTTQAYPSTTRWAKANMDTDWKQAFAEREREQEEAAFMAKMDRDERIAGTVTEKQANFIYDLTNTIASITGADGIKVTTQEFWGQMRAQGLDKQTASRTIDILKESLKAEQAKKSAPAATVPNGRYAVEHEGVLKFYRVNTPTEGRWAGRTFLDVYASDERHAIRNPRTRRDVLALIAEDVPGAMARYGQEIGKCARCGRKLTDKTSRERGIGPDCWEQMG